MPKTPRIYTKVKTIKLTPKQFEKWDSDKIKGFIDENYKQNNPVLDSLIRKLIPAFIEASIEIDLSQKESDIVMKIIEELKLNA